MTRYGAEYKKHKDDAKMGAADRDEDDEEIQDDIVDADDPTPRNDDDVEETATEQSV